MVCARPDAPHARTRAIIFRSEEKQWNELLRGSFHDEPQYRTAMYNCFVFVFIMPLRNCS